jgi:hypothetical protein
MHGHFSARSFALFACIVGGLSQESGFAESADLFQTKACSAAKDCNWAGDCNRTTGQCICDPTWTGSFCEQLNLLPAAKTAIYPSDANTALQSTWTWGGAAVTDKDGRVHMFVTEWRNNCPMTYPSFITQTHIVHVVADTADGPFLPASEHNEVVPSAAGNPVIAQANDGTYLLYFTNYRYDGPVQNCTKPANRHARHHAVADPGGKCTTRTPEQHVDIQGGSQLGQTYVVDAGDAGISSCRKSCCSSSNCSGWVVAAAGAPEGARPKPCVADKPCCWHKTGMITSRPNCSFCSASGIANAPPMNRSSAACGIHLAHSQSLDGPWQIVYDIAYGEGGAAYWDNW